MAPAKKRFKSASPHRPRPKGQAAKREKLREELWPNSEALTWNRHENAGFTTVPRLLSLTLVLIKELAPNKGDPSRVYLDLWLRVYDEGLIMVIGNDEFAYSSGYKGTRALRSWRERVFQLQELGFIDIKPRGNNDIGYILILNPLQVATDLHFQGRVDEEWWNAFVGRAAEITAEIPKPTAGARKKTPGRTKKGP